MTKYTILSNIYRRYIGEELFDRLTAVLPAGLRDSSIGVFGGRIPFEGPALRRILDILTEAGFQRVDLNVAASSSDRTFHLREHVGLDDEDFDAAEYFYVKSAVDPMLSEVVRDERGLVLGLLRKSALRHESIDSQSPFGMQRLVVPDRVRGLLEPEWPDIEWGDVALVRRKTTSGTPRLNWSDVPQRWWQVLSHVELPPVSPTTNLKSPRARGFVEPGTDLPVYPEGDKIYGVRWLRYRRADIESAGPFDLALASEYRLDPVYDRYLICSRRFYDWCNAQGLDFNYMPIGIDED